MDNKKEKILKTALKLFVDKGFHATPTSLIASKSGVANGTLFHYFKTKEELINILYIETKDDHFKYVTKDFNASNKLLERFHKIWVNIITWAMNNSDKFRFLQQFSNSPFIGQLTQEQASHYIKFFEDQFNEGIEKKIIKDLPLSVLLQISLFQIYGFVNYLLENKNKLHDVKLMEMTFESFWDCIRIHN